MSDLEPSQWLGRQSETSGTLAAELLSRIAAFINVIVPLFSGDFQRSPHPSRLALCNRAGRLSRAGSARASDRDIGIGSTRKK